MGVASERVGFSFWKFLSRKTQGPSQVPGLPRPFRSPGPGSAAWAKGPVPKRYLPSLRASARQWARLHPSGLEGGWWWRRTSPAKKEVALGNSNQNPSSFFPDLECFFSITKPCWRLRVASVLGLLLLFVCQTALTASMKRGGDVLAQRTIVCNNSRPWSMLKSRRRWMRTCSAVDKPARTDIMFRHCFLFRMFFFYFFTPYMSGHRSLQPSRLIAFFFVQHVFCHFANVLSFGRQVKKASRGREKKMSPPVMATSPWQHPFPLYIHRPSRVR